VSSDTAYVYITTSVPETFTLEYTCKFDVLPQNFVDIVSRHVFIGITDAAGPCVGLFFSRIGIAYAGGIRHDGSGNLILDSTFQPLPNSQVLISEGIYYTFRIVADNNLGVVYIYVTKTSDIPLIGHQLQFIMPVIDADSMANPPTDRTVISVRGTLGSPSVLSLDSICLSSDSLIPNIPPIADAGLDQAARLCGVTQLDGSKSFDPEGVPLIYSWKLVDAPIGSQFMYDGGSGRTYPLGVPTGFTNKFHSVELAVLDGVDPLVAGEILVVQGITYLVTGKSTDGNGFHVTVEGFELPDSITGTPFKYVRQRGISGPTTPKPTFLPDKPGIFRFELTVSDGFIQSDPSVTIISVTESPVPRGCIPDLRFLWDYLSDFWKLVEDKERIEVFWGSVAQVAASELLRLWQIEYSKSIRDVQRTAQRRWLHYDTLIKETFPDLTTVSGRMSELTSLSLTGTLNAADTTLVLTSSAFSDPITATIPGTNPMTLAATVAQLNASLRYFDPRISAVLFTNTAGTNSYIRILAPFDLTVSSSSTFPTSAFAIGATSGNISGSAGIPVGSFTYKVERSLQGLDLVDAFLVVGGVGYKIRSVISNAADALPLQRVVCAESVPMTVGMDWEIVGELKSTQVNFYDELLTAGDIATVEIIDSTGASTFKELTVRGTYAGDPKLLLVDTTPITAELEDETLTINFFSAKRKKYIPIDDLVADIPYLQEMVKSTDDTAVLRRNVDFFIEPDVRGQKAIRFVTGARPDPDVWEGASPPDILWAELTYLDNNPIIEQNFGIPAEFTLDDLAALPDSVDYLSAVRGLWYSYFKGPTIFNLRVGTQILLGLPFAEEPGTITEIRTDFSPTQGRILVQDTAHTEITRSYTFPLPLELEVNPLTGEQYKVGDTVSQFAPLVTGAEVLDYVKDPKWIEGWLNQGLAFEVEKFFQFLVRVDSAAFNLSALLFVKSFILRIKPTYTFPHFVVLKSIKETEVSTTDDIEYEGLLYLYDGTCFQQNGSTMYGVATMFDEPDPSGGGWQSQLDADSFPLTGAPTFPTPQSVQWGFDKNLLCPEDYILGKVTVTFLVDTMPVFDSIFAFDTELYSDTGFLIFEDSDITHVPAGATGVQLYSPFTASGGMSFTDAEITFDGYQNRSPIPYSVELRINGVVHSTFVITPTDGQSVHQLPLTASLVNGDVVTFHLRHGQASHVNPVWESVTAKVGVSTPWVLDTLFPAGTYSVHRAL
jgi:hypothetical protein